jgi:hypothetical protein
MKDERISSRTPPSGSLSQEAAEAFAIDALSFLAEAPERLDRFMALCGLSPENLRSAASSAGFLAGVLNHLAQDESLLLAFAQSKGCDPKHIILARNCLDPPQDHDDFG